MINETPCSFCMKSCVPAASAYCHYYIALVVDYRLIMEHNQQKRTLAFMEVKYEQTGL